MLSENGWPMERFFANLNSLIVSAIMRTQGFSPVWTLECSLRCDGKEKAFPHNEHVHGFSPVWILMCILRYFESLKDFSHIEQLNGFSPVWLLECFLRSEE